ncbi:HAD-IA family hydrolase [soil metagenome]
MADRRAELLVMDLGGVVCRFHPQRRTEALARLSGQSEAAIDAQVFDSGFDDACDRGRFTLTEIVEQLTSMLDIRDHPDPRGALRACWAAAFQPDRAVVELCTRATVPVTMFTNNGPLVEDALRHQLAGVTTIFEQLVFASHLGATKPDPASYSGAARALGVAGDSIYFVDDSADNAQAARHAGWQAHHFRTALGLTAALTDAGLLPRS